MQTGSHCKLPIEAPWRVNRIAMFSALVFAFAVLTSHAMQAQTFAVLHTFTGGNDGGNPIAGVTVGGAGTLYGTASQGGINNNGIVFTMSHESSGWVLKPIHEFAGFDDGSMPLASVVFGPDGALYGTTDDGGSGGGGTIFRLTPPQTVCKSVLCPWDETVLYAFMPGPGGTCPWYGNLIFDRAGNIYGTTYDGGTNDVGAVYELVHSGGSWTETVLHTFSGGNDGSYPQEGLVFDTAGNLYGTTTWGGGNEQCLMGCGTVFELSPSNGSWTENVLTNFGSAADGNGPISSLILDQSGNLYGTTTNGGNGGGGTVFELTSSSGQWNFSAIYTFSGRYDLAFSPTMDAAGNLYGVTANGGSFGEGMVFKLTHSNGVWTFSDLHDFTGGSDGANPNGFVEIDSSGNLYGTTYTGGAAGGCTYGTGCGVVWEITP